MIGKAPAASQMGLSYKMLSPWLYRQPHLSTLGPKTRQKLNVSHDVVFKEDEFLPFSNFGTISNSEAPFQTPFDDDILDDQPVGLQDFATQFHYNISLQPHRQLPKSNPFALLAPKIPPPPINNSDNDSDWVD